MYTRFNDSTLITKFIQQLLADTAFPIEKTIYYGDYVVKGNTYILENCIVNAKSSGLLTEETFSELLTIVSPYIFENSYPGLTMKFYAANSAYDFKTHYYLGQYLRALRDLKQINLMPFYNCFADQYVEELSFTRTSVDSVSESQYKYISIPVKFGKQYSISIDLYADIQIRCAFIGNKGLIKSDTETLVELFPNTTTTKRYGQISHPYLFDGLQLDDVMQSLDATKEAKLKQLMDKEKYLRLILRLPINCNSSIIVLEGDYTKTNNLYIDKESNPYYIPYNVTMGNLQSSVLSGAEQALINNRFISQLNLIKMSDNYSYPFANRLIEYLLQSVVTSNDSISENISRVQKVVSSSAQKQVNGTEYTAPYTPGVWDINLQNYIYSTSIKNPKMKCTYDLTGFVDKDIEQLITGGE